MDQPIDRDPASFCSKPLESPPNATPTDRLSAEPGSNRAGSSPAGHWLGGSHESNPAELTRRTARRSRSLSKHRVFVEFLRHLPTEQAYRFMWLKRVWNVDLSKHCQPALLGPTSRIIRTRFFWQAPRAFEIKEIYLEPSPSGYFYLCGVTHPYVWAKNFHLPFRFAQGSIAEKRWYGIHIRLQDAEELPLSETFIDPACPGYQQKVYRTCRNAQFAWAFSRGLYQPNSQLSLPVAADEPTGKLRTGLLFQDWEL